jgi:hypothetical protein
LEQRGQQRENGDENVNSARTKKQKERRRAQPELFLFGADRADFGWIAFSIRQLVQKIKK